jgi:hypothetical protein
MPNHPPQNPPTRSDSLMLLNNTRALEKYYQDYDVTSNISLLNSSSTVVDRINVLDRIADIHSFGRDDFNDAMTEGNGIHTDKGENQILPSSEYYQPLNSNQYKQRESAFSIMDVRSPMPIYDSRIAPTNTMTYVNDDVVDELYGDKVILNTYDPLSITPWDMLNKTQQDERVKKFGTKGTPLDPSNITTPAPTATPASTPSTPPSTPATTFHPPPSNPVSSHYNSSPPLTPLPSHSDPAGTPAPDAVPSITKIKKDYLTKTPVLSGLLHSGTLDKELQSIVNPIMDMKANRMAQTIYARDQKGTKGKYPIGESVYNNETKSWTEDRWSQEDQNVSMQLLRKNYTPKASF